ncbi:MAG: DUF2891 domain-containing protein [Gammaproteobacteria bacterium]|nr:DUF2891 domain-containing protein [Gammaproteobacteria bacterium]
MLRTLLYLCLTVTFPSSLGAIVEKNELPKLGLTEANRLAQMPISCVETQYPNKLNQVLGNKHDLKEPKELHPTFYGCFDWHSPVHGHWSMVSLLKNFPDIASADKLKSLLKTNITKQNIAREVEYFYGKYNKSWERTYGWAWLLKLAEELHTWDDPLARELEKNLDPLSQLLADKFIEFLPKLHYPIRVGEHPNTAFGMSFAHDYAVAVGNFQLKNIIERRAKDLYFKDENCPVSWEPSGFDFLSPCLQEMDIMRRVLNEKDFKKWLKKFLPNLDNTNYDLKVGIVNDRKDGKLVHLDGVNFSRAWCLYALGKQYPTYRHLLKIANKHINKSLPYVVGDSYEGGHWLGSFAIYSLNSSKL